MEKLTVTASILIDGDLCGWERKRCQFRYEDDNGVWCSLYRFEPIDAKYIKSDLRYREVRCKSCSERKDLSK